MVDILKIFIDDKYQFQVSGHYLIAVIIIAIFVLCYLLLKLIPKKLFKSFEINEAQFGIGSATVKLVVNTADLEAAYKIWVELSTRKIGLEIDFETDTIVEVYDSWYNCFKIVRELIKTIPVTKAKQYKATRNLITLSVDVLNLGLRPHLTTWQAKFRKWYGAEVFKEKNKTLSPQEIQKTYEQYQDLKQDMILVNQRLMAYTRELKKITIGE